MTRTRTRALTWRTLGLTALAVAMIAVMVALGLWQLGVYDDRQDAEAREAQFGVPVPLDDILQPDEPFASSAVGRPVTVAGTYSAAEQLYVRDLPGTSLTYAVVTPLVTASGSAVLVVRGASDSPEAVPPAGSVTVDGILEPSQSDGSELDDQRVTDGIRIASLVSAVDDDLYAGYVILDESDPAETLDRVNPPLGDASRWAGVRNLLYAVQWWVFAAFVLFMWWRILNESEDAEPLPAVNPRDRTSHE